MKHLFRFKYTRLAPLDTSDQQSFLVALSHQAPRTLFEYPLYLLRRLSPFVKLYRADIEMMTWQKENDGSFTVKLTRGVTLQGLRNVDVFKELKEKLHLLTTNRARP